MFFVRSRLYTKEKATLNREGVLERERNREREEEKFFCFFTLLNLLLLWLLPRYFFFFFSQIKTKTCLRFLFVPAFQDVAAHVPLHLHLLLT